MTVDFAKTRVVIQVEVHKKLVMTEAEKADKYPDDEYCLVLETLLSQTHEEDPISNFSGGVEISKELYETAEYEGGLLKDAFPLGNIAVESLDGSTVAIHCCEVLRVGKDGFGAWSGANWKTVVKFNDLFGLPMTKSVFQNLIKGDKYRNQEVI